VSVADFPKPKPFPAAVEPNLDRRPSAARSGQAGRGSTCTSTTRPARTHAATWMRTGSGLTAQATRRRAATTRRPEPDIVTRSAAPSGVEYEDNEELKGAAKPKNETSTAGAGPGLIRGLQRR